MSTVTKPVPERIFYSVKETGALLGISNKSVYRLVERGFLKSSNALRHRLILRSSIDEFVANTVK